MRMNDEAVHRVARLMAYWGLVKHPYGHEYAKRNYTPLGGVDR